MEKNNTRPALILTSLIFLMAAIFSFASITSAQILKPGELIYSRSATVVGGNCDTATIWAVGLDGSNDRFITNGLHPRISPDGRVLLFKRYNASTSCDPFFNGAPQFWIRDLATRREMQIYQNFGISFGHLFSPETNRDDRQIIFQDASSICTMNLDGSNPVCLAGNLQQLLPMREPRQLSVRGSDGRLVSADYDSNFQSTGGLYTLNYDLGDRQKITNTTYGDLNPSWSNHGLTIAYGITNNSNRGAKGPFINLFTIKPDGTNKTQLTFLPEVPGEGFYHSLVWTLDNLTIIDAAKINGVAGIYKIAADGGGTISQIPITPGAPPEWVGGIAPVYSEQQVAAFGGGSTSGSVYTLVDTIGQAFAGQTSFSGPYSFESGFWAIPAIARTSTFDYDGDRQSDISIFRPSTGSWYLQRSTAGLYGTLFGFSDDKITPADYDGDGKTDIAVYRASTGIWYVMNSSNGTVSYFNFGTAEDLPTPADYDGDGIADVSVFRPSNATWYRRNSSDGSFYAIQFGLPEDKPTIGDFDGDGRSDIAIFRPSDGAWYEIYSSDASLHGREFGFATDVIVHADYDGDGKTDVAVFRPSDGIWYIANSSDGTVSYNVFGLADDVPAPGDFDGDGKADISVFRPSDGTWYRRNSSDGSFFSFPFGANGDKPTQTAFRY